MFQAKTAPTAATVRPDFREPSVKKNQQKKKDLSIHFQFYFRVVVHEKWPQALLEHLARAEPTEHPDRTAATESLDHPVRKVIDFFVKLNFKLS